MRLALSARTFFIVSTLFFNLQAFAFAQTPAPVVRPRTASISGRVTIGGQPAVGKKVLVMDVNTGWGSPDVSSGEGGTQGRTHFIAVTDADGQYRLTGLPRGDYEVNVSLLSAYVPVGREGRRSRSIILDEGEAAKNIDFTLTRGGVITGRLTDADGIPVIGARVLANTIDKDGVKRWEWNLYNRKAMTDDRGVYRIYGLPPGRYRVSADGSEVGPDTATFTDKGKGYPRVYHPNVPDEAKAAIAEVKEGGEVNGIDINLGKKRALYEVTGRVTDSEAGRPLSQPQMLVRCSRVNSEGLPIESFVIQAIVDSQGNFRFAGLTSGLYSLDLSSRSIKQEPYSGRVIFEVKEKKVSGLEIKTERQIVIKGVAVFDNRSNLATGDWLPYASITGAISADIGSSSFGGMPAVILTNDASKEIEDGEVLLGSRNFGFHGVPDGAYELRVYALQGFPLSAPLRVTVKGADITGLNLRPLKTSSISGWVVVEPPKPGEGGGEKFSVEEMFLRVKKVDATERKQENILTAINEKGDFVQPLEDGVYRIIPNLPGDNWYVRAITRAAKEAPNKTIDVARDGVTVKLSEALTGVEVSVAKCAARLRGRIAVADEPQMKDGMLARWRVHLVPAEETAAENVLRYAETDVQGDASFELKHIAPGKYYLLAQKVVEKGPADNQFRLAAWDDLERAKLRREAQALNQEIELRPCQQINDYLLRNSANRR